jgi:hypothetical protein
VPLGFVAAVLPIFGLFGVALPGAVKARARHALWALAALALCATLAFAALLADSAPSALVFILSLAAGLCHAAALINLPPGKVGRWAYAPAVLPIMLAAALAVGDIRLRAQVQKLEADFCRASGLATSIAAYKAHLNDVIPKDDPSLETLLAELAQLPPIPRINPPGGDGGPSAAQAQLLQDFATTHADLFARADTITTRRDLRFLTETDGNQQWLTSLRPMEPFGSFVKMGNWYLAKGRHAAWRGDGATAIDCIDRLDNLTIWPAHSPHFLSQLYCTILENQKLNCLEAAVPILSDADLATQQRQAQTYQPDAISRCRANLMASYVSFIDAAHDAMTLETFSDYHRTTARKIRLPLLRLYLRLAQRGILQYAIHEIGQIDSGAHAEPQLYDNLEGDAHALWGRKNVRLRLATLFAGFAPAYRDLARVVDRHRAAAIGMAVEHYRRRHGALPEELSELVPLFLEHLPLSSVTGEPFAYQRGTFEVPWLTGDRKTREIHGYQVFGRHSDRHPRLNPRFVVWLGDTNTASVGASFVVKNPCRCEHD